MKPFFIHDLDLAGSGVCSVAILSDREGFYWGARGRIAGPYCTTERAIAGAEHLLDPGVDTSPSMVHD